MGITIHELRAVVSGNLVGFSQMVDGAISKTHSLRKAWGDFASDAARATNRVVNTFAVLGGAGAAMSVKLGFSFNAVKEQAEIAFTTMLGDGQKAKKFIADLTEFAAKTPFQISGLLDSTKKLMAFGFEAEKIIPMLTVVGDTAAAMGNPQVMDRMILALGQMQAKGKVSAQEMNQLAEAGIGAWKFLADEIGISIPEAMKLAENGAISASVAIPAILKGAADRFGGSMKDQSKTWVGLLSTLADQVSIWTGKITEPLYNSFRNGLSKMLGGNSTQVIEQFIDRIRASMSTVAAQVDAIFAQDPATLFASVGSVVEKSVQVFASLVEWLRQASPEFAEAGRKVWEFVSPLLDFLRDNPKIVAALVFLKMTGFLGVNQAVVSFGGAIAKSILEMGRMSGASSLLGSAIKGIGFAAAAAAIIYMAEKLYQANSAIKDYNAAVKESQALNQKLDQRTDRKRELRLREISEMSDPALRRDAYSGDIEKQKKELQGYESSAMGLAADADAFANSLTDENDIAGNKILESMRAEADRAAQQARSAQAYIYRLEDELHNAEKEIEKAVGGGLAGADTGSPTGPATGTGGSILDAPQDQLPGNQVADKSAEEAAQRLETATNEVDGFVKRIAGLVDLLPEETLQSFEREFNDIQQDFIEGEIDAREYRAELDYLNETINLSAEAANNATRFEDQLAAFRERLSGQGVDLGAAAISGFQSRFNSLNQQFAAGDISARRFAQATDALQREMDAAGNAAIKELQAKERARLLSGNFTQAEFQKAAEDRIIALRMQQFDRAVETAVNGMLGLNQGFETLQNGVNQFGNGLQYFGQGGGYFGAQSIDFNQLAAANATYTSFLQTTQGRISDLMNSIGLAQSRLSLSSLIYGDVVSGAERWKTVEQIEQWTRELVELQKAPPPQFVQGLGAFEYKDPGLQYGSGGQGGSLTLNFPNLTRMGNQDVQDLVAAINREQQRQGRPLFGSR